MVALQCHDVLHICSDTRLLLTEPPTQDKARRLPKDHLPRRVLVRVRKCVSVRSKEPSRAVSKPSVAPAPALCHWDAGQQLRTDGARRWAGARFDALYCRCILLHDVPLGGRRDCARVVVGDARTRLASRVSGSVGITCRCRSFQHTHA